MYIFKVKYCKCEMCLTHNVNDLCKYWLTTVDCIDKDWQITDPTSRQRGRPKKDKTVTLKKKISGQKSQIGLDTKTYWLTDRQP
jgi:hypothetical protein